MPKPKPYVDTTIKEGIKRTYWYEADIASQDRALRRQAAKAVSKRDKRYSPQDQRKIVAEKWQEICERHAPPGE